MDQHEKFFDCPHCGEVVSVLLDLSVPNQEYIEDCEVCCRPIEISYQINADGEIGFEGEKG
jgi:transcription elongation factor Elf1